MELRAPEASTEGSSGGSNKELKGSSRTGGCAEEKKELTLQVCPLPSSPVPSNCPSWENLGPL
eukprot:7301570-Alexandrium_andersonii.AAC.1